MCYLDSFLYVIEYCARSTMAVSQGIFLDFSAVWHGVRRCRAIRSRAMLCSLAMVVHLMNHELTPELVC